MFADQINFRAYQTPDGKLHWEFTKKDNGKTIELPDGYNGDTAKFYTNPIEIDGNLIKLQCAEPNKEYMFRWVYADTFNKLMVSNED